MELEKSGPQPLGRARLRVGFEKFSTIAREVRFLTTRQQAEMGSDQPYAPDWETYLAYERSGSLILWTARTIESNTLVGYIVWMTTRGLRCVDTVFANGDTVYLAPEWREGMTGYKFLKSGIDAMSPFVDMLKIETAELYENGRMGVLLKRLGFRRIGAVYQRAGR